MGVSSLEKNIYMFLHIELIYAETIMKCCYIWLSMDARACYLGFDSGCIGFFIWTHRSFRHKDQVKRLYVIKHVVSECIIRRDGTRWLKSEILFSYNRLWKKSSKITWLRCIKCKCVIGWLEDNRQRIEGKVVKLSYAEKEVLK